MSFHQPTMIILAAGQSLRMGEPKALLEIEGKSWIQHQLEQGAQYPCPKAIVVLGHHQDAIETEIKKIRDEFHRRSIRFSLETKINPEPRRGAFSSFLCGIENLQDSWIAVTPIDVPLPKLESWNNVVELCQENEESLVPTYLMKKGHPVFIPVKIYSQLGKISPDDPDARLNIQLRRYPQKLVEVDDPGVTLHFNTPQEWRQFRTSFSITKAHPAR